MMNKTRYDLVTTKLSQDHFLPGRLVTHNNGTLEVVYEMTQPFLDKMPIFEAAGRSGKGYSWFDVFDILINEERHHLKCKVDLHPDTDKLSVYSDHYGALVELAEFVRVVLKNDKLIKRAIDEEVAIEAEFEPCTLVDHDDDHYSLVFSIMGVFEEETKIFKEFGLEGNGHDWYELIHLWIDDYLPELNPNLRYDTESSMFVAHSNDLGTLRSVAGIVRSITLDDNRLRDAIRRMMRKSE